jgi:hypothetical protein
MLASGSMKGESSIVTSLRIGRASRCTSNRPAPEAANTATPRVPLASNSFTNHERMRSTSCFSASRCACSSWPSRSARSTTSSSDSNSVERCFGVGNSLGSRFR